MKFLTMLLLLLTFTSCSSKLEDCIHEKANGIKGNANAKTVMAQSCKASCRVNKWEENCEGAFYEIIQRDYKD